MSRIRIHSYQQEPVALPGWERAHLIVQCCDYAFSYLWPHREDLGELFKPFLSNEEDR